MRFAGLDVDDYAALGRMTVAVGAMEWTAYEVARALGVARTGTEHAFKGLPVVKALGKARAQAERSMPPWATIDREPVLHWIDRAREVLKRRNALVHAVVLAGESAASITPLRTREARPFARQEVIDLAESADWLAWDTGLPVYQGLLHKMRDGGYRVEPRLHRTGDVLWLSLGDAIGTPAERDTWWERRLRTAPPDWHTWPD